MVNEAQLTSAVFCFILLKLCCGIPVRFRVFQPICATNAQCGWAGGSALQVAVNIMVDYINRASYLRGNHTLIADVVDSECSDEVGSREAGRLLARPANDTTFALIGCGCSGCTGYVAQIIFPGRIPMLSPTATFGYLSNRVKYPALFRMLPVDFPIYRAFLLIFLGCGWTTIALFFGGVTLDQRILDLVLAMGMINVLSNTTQLTMSLNKLSNSSPFQVSWQIVQTRVRAVIAVAHETYARALACETVRTYGMRGLIIAHPGWYRTDWHRKDLSKLSCSAQQMDVAVAFSISGKAVPWGHRNRSVPCSLPNYTIEGFIDEYLMRVANGNVSANDESPAAADSVCMMARVFNQLLDEGFSLSSLFHMDEQAFVRSLALMQSTNFYGVSGQITFGQNASAYGAGDRIADYLIQQFVNGTLMDIAVLHDGKTLAWTSASYMLFDFNYTYNINPPPALFFLCANGTIYDYQVGDCVSCPNHTQFVRGANSLKQDVCASQPGYFTHLGSVLECPAGTYSVATGTTECLMCSPGEYSPMNASRSCFRCSPGYAGGSVGLSRCNACPVGRFSNSYGRVTCRDCSVGESMATTGKSECTSCPVGKYANRSGLVNCTDCPPKEVTLEFNLKTGRWLLVTHAEDQSFCGCDIDMLRNKLGMCVRCGTGLTCIGKGHIVVQEGYAFDGDESVFKCIPEPKQCPGGAPGVCASGRVNTSIGCTACLPSYTPGDDGTCRKCAEGDVAKTTILVICAVAVVALLYYVRQRRNDHNIMHPALLMAAITLGQLVTMVQYLGIVSLVPIEWPEAAIAIFRLAHAVNFNIDVAGPECVAPVSVLTRYVSRLLSIVAMQLLLIIFHIINICIFKRCRRVSDHWQVIIGTLGISWVTFFISICTTILIPFQCDTHPNGKMTLRSFPGVMCSNSADYQAMLIIASIASCMPFSFLILTVYVVQRLPTHMAAGDTVYLRRWAFLLVRFRPEAVWFVPLYILRSALLACTPVLTRPMSQILWMQSVLFVSLIFILVCRPFRVWQANVIDAGSNTGMLCMLAGASFFVQAEDKMVISRLIIGCLIFLCSMFAIGGAVVIHRILTFKVFKRYLFFLCHHKGGAGASARLLKQTLSRKANGRKIYIDSDDLKDLATLFHTVAFDTRVLVVCLTSNVLMRPWCVGEIATSHRNNVDAVVLAFPDGSMPTNDFIEAYYERVPSIAMLGKFNINLPLVQQALRRLNELTAITLPIYLTQRAVTQACEELNAYRHSGSVEGLKYQKLTHRIQSSVQETSALVVLRFSEAGNGTVWESKASSRSALDALKAASDSMMSSVTRSQAQAKVIIIADPSNYEAMASALVLYNLTITYLAHDKPPFVLEQGERVESADVSDLIIICTNGVFLEPSVIEVIMQGYIVEVAILPVLAEVNFRYPNVASLRKDFDFYCLEDVWAPGEAAPIAVTPHMIKEIICDIFQEIGIVFQLCDAAGTEMTLRTKAKEVAQRIHMPGRRDRRLSSRICTGSSGLRINLRSTTEECFLGDTGNTMKECFQGDVVKERSLSDAMQEVEGDPWSLANSYSSDDGLELNSSKDLALFPRRFSL